jgi:hypothetical protein
MSWHKRKNAKEEENIEAAAIQSSNWSNADIQQMWNNIRYFFMIMFYVGNLHFVPTLQQRT